MEPHPDSGRGVDEGQARRMQELPGRPPGQFPGPSEIRTAHATLPSRSVERVSHDRVSQVSNVHTDLMGAPRAERNVEQLGRRPPFPNPHPREGRTTVLDDRHALPILAGPANGRVDLER